MRGFLVAVLAPEFADLFGGFLAFADAFVAATVFLFGII